jgi:hypothetical protein
MEQYVYTSNHLPALKKYGVMKILFLLLGCLTLLLQSLAWLIVWMRDMPVSKSDMWFVAITLVSAFYFIAGQCFFLARNRKIINMVSDGGTFVCRRTKIRFSNKASVGGAIALFCKIIAILFVILLGILIVSFIQNYLKWGKVILKMPLMVFLTVSFLHTSAEVRYQALVEKSK